MGSPDFAVPTLNALIEYCKVVGVVTQPDRPAGRGRKLTPPPIKVLAEEKDLPVIQPKRLSEPDAMQQLHIWDPDLIVVAAFGQILKPNVLELPEHGCINVHASLLPRWRGAAPIHAAIRHGDAETGVTIMRMDEGLDTGPMLSKRAIPITDTDTTGSLSPRLADLGAGLLIETLPQYLRGKISLQAQDDEQATYAPMLKKQEGALDFSLPAEALARQVRAFHPWPGTFTTWNGGRLKVLKAHAIDKKAASSGETGIEAGLPAISTLDGWLVLEQVQPAGKKPMSGGAFLNGNPDWGKIASSKE
ncbi:MAG: methionyl-tRNA formyltransferase [Chloroflexi bacterium]|nr:MAG: methionyl-tRNA formyltransferase [Chloroflexota bacterium]MBL1195836.1 methionyl-tRNA formyltransferase [Chloroflexota bacterium]NOH13128.1 methionyl-tRNA formyltransferase [Chloroflexota bacterium]